MLPLPYLRVIFERFERQDGVLDEILQHTKHTNSRVTQLELHDALVRDRLEQSAARETLQAQNRNAWRNALLGGILGLFSGVAGYALLALTGHPLG